MEEELTEEQRLNHLLGDPEEMGRIMGPGYIGYIEYPEIPNYFPPTVSPSSDFELQPIRTIRVEYEIKKDINGKFFWSLKL